MKRIDLRKMPVVERRIAHEIVEPRLLVAVDPFELLRQRGVVLVAEGLRFFRVAQVLLSGACGVRLAFQQLGDFVEGLLNSGHRPRPRPVRRGEAPRRFPPMPRNRRRAGAAPTARETRCSPGMRTAAAYSAGCVAPAATRRSSAAPSRRLRAPSSTPRSPARLSRRVAAAPPSLGAAAAPARCPPPGRSAGTGEPPH